ncbi:MAG: KEOPS complex subunit Cgi121 [Candidatus Nitrosocaldus sp.]|nr:KEOPS complex subunit Cgi121 [Candidatus Nitrosocaldus sp.]MDW8275489.1 KEOPS complex subunit Cgi121 [Candidatus Nitrosocaldus sp.]
MVKLSNDGRIYHAMLLYMDVSLDDPEEFVRSVRSVAEGLHRRTMVQMVDAHSIAGVEHLLEILTQSLEAERRSCMLARMVEVDMMLRLACTRQISEAIERVGLKSGSRRAALVAVVYDDDDGGGSGYGRGGLDDAVDVGGNVDRDGGRKSGEREMDHQSILLILRDRLKEVDGVIRVLDGDDGVNTGDDLYERIAHIHGLSEQELDSCISSNRLVSILAERANILHR